MSRFNTPAIFKAKTTNLAGGEAFAQSPRLEMISMLLTSFAGEQFYRSSGDNLKRLKELVHLVDPLFAAKAAVYARTRFGMRSITHALASEVATRASGQPWAKGFYAAVALRPDDVTETLAYHLASGGKITAAMKDGFGRAFGKWDGYQLAKYRAEGKAVSLVDAVNLLHPLPTDRNREALAALVKDELRASGTWEAALTAAGRSAESEDEKTALKSAAWSELIATGKLGYFALLRNLRAILRDAPEAVDAALAMLVDAGRIRKSLVLPFRFATAYDELRASASDVPRVNDALSALSRAVDVSLVNIPRFEGRTLVVLDVSGSMMGRPAQIGSLFAAMLVKATRTERSGAELMLFSDSAEYRAVNTSDSTLTIAQSIRFATGGTNFHAIFQKAKRAYDRIVILSDMQGWVGHNAPTADYEKYCRKYRVRPHLYSFDLAGHGTMQFPQERVYCLAGFSDKVFELMSLLETDRDAMVSAVEAVRF